MTTNVFSSVLAVSERVGWKIDDIISDDKRLDFGRRMLPESLARVESLDFLSEDERRTLNHIRAVEYLSIFGLVEEFILPFVLDHARPHLPSSDDRVRAMLQFANEEAKHIELFRRFHRQFEEDFGSRCDVIGPPADIARAVLGHDPLAVALVILHIEWMTQRHFLESVRDEAALDPQFKSLLKHHWLEEAQHAKLDEVMVAVLAEGRDAAGIQRGIDDYLKIGALLDGGLTQQMELDLEAFTRKTGRVLTEDEAARYREAQLGAVRWSYLGSGMTHPAFLAAVERLSPEARHVIEHEVAPTFC